jgi:GNAT superfamily N-acetyltransferase
MEGQRRKQAESGWQARPEGVGLQRGNWLRQHRPPSDIRGNLRESGEDALGNDGAMYTIRLRTSSDMDELVDLTARVSLADSYPVYLPDHDLYRFLTEPSPLAAWVAEEDGQILAHVATNSESNDAVMKVVREAGIAGEIGFIARLLVDPCVRRQGIGASLLDHARRFVASVGRIPVLDVVDSALPAISLYKSAGWIEIGKASFNVPGRVITELVFTAQT